MEEVAVVEEGERERGRGGGGGGDAHGHGPCPITNGERTLLSAWLKHGRDWLML